MSTKKQANTIYRAYKQGELTLPKGFASKMYKVVGMDWYELRHCYDIDGASSVAHRTAVAASYIWDGRIDLAQAVIDGKTVDEVVVTETISEFEVTQDVLDNPEAYGIGKLEIMFYSLGSTYTKEEDHIEYVVR